MLSTTLAVLVLGVTPASVVKGGTAAQQAKVKAILDRLPDCITAPGGVPVAVQIVSGTGPQATFEGQDGTLRIDASLLDAASFGPSSLAYRQDMCATPGEIGWMATDTRRVIVHELAHALQRNGKTGRRNETVSQRLEGFFALRFDAEFEIWENDPMRIEYENDLAGKLDEAQQLRKRRVPVPGTLVKEICDLHDELRAIYDQRGLPARFGNDRHAAKEPELNHATGKRERAGAEFFGIAIETLVGDHGRFCRQFTREEQSWLATELGDCLGGLPGKSPCYPQPNTSQRRTTPGANGAGMARD